MISADPAEDPAAVRLRPASASAAPLPFLAMPLGAAPLPEVPGGLSAEAHGLLEREVTFALMLNTRARVLSGASGAGPDVEGALAALFRVLDRMPGEIHPVQRRFVTAKLCFLAGASLLLCDAPEADLHRFAGPIDREIDRAGLDGPVETDAPVLRLSARNNHVALRALALIVAARLCRTPPRLARARDLLRHYLAGMDEGGLFPAETVRGASALWYCNLAVMLLHTAAWIGHCSGLDLMPAAALHRAVDGLARSVADPAALHRAARRNMYPNPRHGPDPTRLDRGFLEGYHRGRHYLAWVPLHGALCPGAALDPVFAPVGDAFPWGNEFIGGFADVLLRPRPPAP